jgi:hypothetical protein
MDIVLVGITALFDLVLKPFEYLPAWVGLAVISAIAGIVLLKLFGVFSNQMKIRKAKDEIKACLLGIALYRNDFRVMLRMQGKMLMANVRYLTASLPSILVLVVICVPLLGQLNVRYGYRPFAVNETFSLYVYVDDKKHVNDISLKTNGAIKAVTPALRIKDTGEVDWKLEAETPGRCEIAISNSGHDYSKRITVGDHASRVEPLRTKSYFYALLYPGEELLPSESKIESVEIKYPGAEVNVFGYEMHWLWVFCVVSIASGLAFKRWLKVEI